MFEFVIFATEGDEMGVYRSITKILYHPSNVTSVAEKNEGEVRQEKPCLAHIVFDLMLVFQFFISKLSSTH